MSNDKDEIFGADLEVGERGAVFWVVLLAEEQVPEALGPAKYLLLANMCTSNSLYTHLALTFRSSTTGMTVCHRLTGSAGS
jgi:hypothetical protein